MPVLKLSYPGAPKGWAATSYMNPNFKLLEKWKILVNTEVDEADAWFVLEDLVDDVEKCKVPAGMTFLGNLETSYEQDWVINNKFVMDFYDQFDKTYSLYLHSPIKTIASPPFLPWMIHANHGPSVWEQPSFEIIQNNFPDLNKKEEKIAVFCSLQNLTPAHRTRLQFVRYLKSHFGESLDWFGNGVKFTPDKWNVLKNYQYSVVLENQDQYNVITEKISDAYLGLTFPFYWGAPNLNDYFDRRGYEPISINDFKNSIHIIEQGIAASTFHSNIDFLIANRNFALNDFNFLHRILTIVDQRFTTSAQPPLARQLYSTRFLKQSLGLQVHPFKTTMLVNLSKIDERKGTNLAPLLNEIIVFFHKILPMTKIRKFFARKLH